jgi:hypothetical protein
MRQKIALNRSILVLEPVAPPEGPEMHLTNRPRSLKGLRIALIDENQPNAQLIMESLAQQLTTKAGVGDILYRNFKTNFGYDLVNGKRKTAPADSLEEICSKVDAAIVGVAH